MTIDFTSASDAVRFPGNNDIIYKDECVLSFDTPESDNGLYINLTSFLGFGEDYYKQYYEKKKLGVFLHHRRTKKEIKKTEEEGPEKKITRLAIGVEGGFSADSGPKYEYTDKYSIVVLPNSEKVPLDDSSIPAKIRNCADAVIAADSSFKKAELAALEATWDGEVRVVSKYAEKLVQLDNGKKLESSQWKCNDCDLTSNLWLNLTDGAILCGRRNFDGSGGNNHGIEYYQKTGYPLAVKLGTITKDGRADVFSYPEDDLVLDPWLSKHLAHFGIDIQSLEKTDKSMAELEIDLNQRVGEWITCQESDKALVPAYGPGRTGMVNLGNTCYMNSVMQVVFTIPDFIHRFVDDYHAMIEASNYNDPARDMLIQFGKLGFGLCSGKYSQPPPEGSTDHHQPGINPRMFRHLVAAGHREFSSTCQQDAQEYFLHVINILDRHCRNSVNPGEVFKFRMEDRFQCLESNKVMYTERAEYCLPLPVPMDKATNRPEVDEFERRKAQNPQTPLVRPSVPVEECLKMFAEADIIDRFYSSATGRHGQARKTMGFGTFPNYLMVQLKKFALVAQQAVKLDVAVDMPDSLDLEYLRGSGLRPDEELLPNEEAPVVNLNMAVVNELVEVGCPLEAAKKAVYYSNGGFAEAYTWYDQHMNDADIMSPFVPPGAPSGQSKVAALDESAVVSIMEMGFTRPQAELALRNTDNNTERALDWIFSHPDEIAEPQTEASAPKPKASAAATYKDGPGKYRLRAFVTHMGTSASVGHYVCHILQDDQWLIFNDNKVAFSQNPPKELGYLYLYERVSS